MQNLVLASSSKYRGQILEKLQLTFHCCGSDVDETPFPGEAPADLALRLATAKAQAVAKTYPQHLIIGSDQVADCDGGILGKPGNRERALRQLQLQAGKETTFYTGLCLLDSNTGNLKTDLDICRVHFRDLGDEQLKRYLDREQPYQCAGSFKSEGYGIVLFDKIAGEDPNALVGLPLIKLIGLLHQFGVHIP
ncbi:Maf family nucleotide pyrophosphatase [Methylomonas sp. SURF-2]|uniref:7-methyl-GTP pyrophosphatase n=1 Tax=Methylomonas subterranea TaxID=2952225 RepID=A0ABT1TI89_9GAMM|nr:nucleoside triphosphate pyrophosphatase [Methylomonas sp. SURF-2]MCQ8105173.1 Maf family nucleotide pyrophosphatase [Methylomonas sp. SURF-2]